MSELTDKVFKIILPKVCRLRPEVDITGAQQAQLLADEIVPLVRKATLKAVGERLLRASDDEHYTIIHSLLKGEMPEEVK